MKILVFGMTNNPGGIESVIMNYYRKINKKYFQFDFLCNTDHVAYEDEILQLGGKIYHIAMRSKNRKQYYLDLDNFFRDYSKRYDAIWVNVCSLANIDYLRWAKKYGIRKRIIHSHNSQNMDSFLRGLLHRFNKLFIKNWATDFWSCSEEASKWFFKDDIINSNRYHLIHNGIDVNRYSYNEELSNSIKLNFGLNNSFVVGNVGRLHFQKNQMFLIDVFYEIKKLKSNSVLLLIGDGSDKNKLISRVHELGLDDSVQFLGVRSDIESLLLAMDVMVFPSLFEGLPVALIEAQAASLPVYMSKSCISPYIKMSDYIHEISLDESPSVWAQCICSNDTNRSELDPSSIGKLGYDINVEVKKLECFFREG